MSESTLTVSSAILTNGISASPQSFRARPEVYAIPNQEASTVAEALATNFFCRFGIVTKAVTSSLSCYRWFCNAWE
jgi:hypothetical protein